MLKSKEQILECVRQLITEASEGDTNAWFEINRWVYARLQLDERRKKPRKVDLLNKQNGLCYYCDGEIKDIKGTDTHRIDESRWYDEGNVALVHRSCHPRSSGRTQVTFLNHHSSETKTVRSRKRVFDAFTRREFHGLHQCYLTLLREGQLEEMRKARKLAPFPQEDNFGYYRMRRFYPGRFIQEDDSGWDKIHSSIQSS
jgi:hypothetical protein